MNQPEPVRLQGGRMTEVFQAGGLIPPITKILRKLRLIISSFIIFEYFNSIIFSCKNSN